jgi:hypothetical protein
VPSTDGWAADFASLDRDGLWFYAYYVKHITNRQVKCITIFTKTKKNPQFAGLVWPADLAKSFSAGLTRLQFCQNIGSKFTGIGGHDIVESLLQVVVCAFALNPQNIQPRTNGL